jgi:3-hexulose-6-phosphate synthase / 6-phospho-3-hexuloisomerase
MISQVDLLSRCRAVATSTWSDALDTLGISGVIHGLTLRSGTGAVAGRAITVREIAGALDDYPPSMFTPSAFLEAAERDSIIVLAIGGAPVSSCGGLVAQAAVLRGVAGLVVDGGCRDLADIRASGLWVMSRHVTPVSGRRRVRVDAINVPVTVGGIRVSAGDYLVGDDTGLVCIPAARLDDALRLAEELTEKDTRFSTALREGHTFAAAAAHLGHV